VGPPFADKFFQKEMHRGFNPHTHWVGGPLKSQKADKFFKGKPNADKFFKGKPNADKFFQREKSRQVFQGAL